MNTIDINVTLVLKDNIYVVNSIAEARFYEGNDSAALLGFQRVR
jgi:hypothetical protein